MIDTNARGIAPGPWGPRSLTSGETIAVRIGPRDLWLRLQDGEIWISDAKNTETRDPTDAADGDPEPEPPPELEWSRWAPPGSERDLRVVPVMFDRPLVLQPERPFTLLPGAEALIYVRVPLWIRIELARAGAGEAEGLLLRELPSVELSDTWWGDFLGGQLCYWLPTTARREIRPELFAPHLAVCPLLMANRSLTELRVEKLSFRVEHLTLFATDMGIWTDTSRVSYRGDEEGSQIEMTGRPPSEASGARMLTPPRIPPVRGLRARTFSRLKEIPGVGGIW